MLQLPIVRRALARINDVCLGRSSRRHDGFSFRGYGTYVPMTEDGDLSLGSHPTLVFQVFHVFFDVQEVGVTLSLRGHLGLL